MRTDLVNGVTTFTGTGSPEHAARLAGDAFNEWLKRHKWKTLDGRPIYHVTQHFERIDRGDGVVWGAFFIHALGPIEETPE